MNDWKKSVYSDTTENFVSNPYPQKGETVTISVRVLKTDEIKHVFLRARVFGVEQLFEMKKSFELNSLQYYSAEVQVRDPYYNYHFYFVTEKEILYYTQHELTDYIPSEEHDFVLLADYDAPKWVRDTVFYQIFPDRFCNGKESLNVKNNEYTYQGFSTTEEKWETPAMEYEEGHNMDFRNGDLYGIIEKLDYLQELGINGIYLNPIFISPSIHKYDALDYFHIDPHLGGDQAFSELIKEMHRRGMKLLLDISINHTSSASKWFNKESEFYPASEGAYQNKNSPYRNYYFFKEDGSYLSWFGVETMPQLNYTSQELCDTIYRKKDSVLKKWMLPPYGIDGWRFDVADCMGRNDVVDVHDQVIEEIRKELKSVKSDAYLVAEEWADCACDLKGKRWDATMNYFGVGRPVREFVGAKDLYHERNEVLRSVPHKLTAKEFASRVKVFLRVVPGVVQMQQFNLFDSHDVVRLHNIPSVKYEDYLNAVVLLLTLPGSASIYYGDEIFLEGRTNSVDACRFPFDWNWKADEKKISMRKFYQQVIALRKGNKEFSEGSFAFVSEEGYTVSYARFTKEKVFFVLASTDDEESFVTIPFENFGIKKDARFSKEIGFEPEISSEGKIKVPPHGHSIFSFSVEK